MIAAAQAPRSRRGHAERAWVGGMRIDAVDYAAATARIMGWARRGQRRYVCAANVHMVMEAWDSADFCAAVNAAGLVTADGMPLVWLLRWRGCAPAARVYGPDLMLAVCRAAAAEGIPIALFGGNAALLAHLSGNLRRTHPGLRVVALLAPPFGRFTAAQNAGFARQLAESRARIVFVGLGCPKQEAWMASWSFAIPAVLIGVGAAFAFHAGLVRQSPGWMQRIGLEWAFRLAMEPRRLWRRYLRHNPRFLWLVAQEQWHRWRRNKPEIYE